MSTPTTIKNQLNKLIAAANTKSGKNDTTITDAINTLIAGYGTGDTGGGDTGGGDTGGGDSGGNTPELISFSIDGTEYTAEEGMTWLEWCNSTYSNGMWTCDFYVMHGESYSFVYIDYMYVEENMEIIEGAEYWTGELGR